MRQLTNELKNRKIIIDKLLTYGFICINDEYIYEKEILNNEFKVIITISKSHEITSKVIEIAYNEEYLLVDVVDASGDFVGKVKEEYENILKDVINKCTIEDVFKSKQAIEIINYIKNKYDDNLEFLWKKFDNNAIWRNKTNNKWYGALLIITEDKLGIDSNKTIEIIDLRYQKESINEIVDNKKVYPGYHMNKNSWITIKLDNSVKTEEIYKLIDNSYNISLNK